MRLALIMLIESAHFPTEREFLYHRRRYTRRENGHFTSLICKGYQSKAHKAKSNGLNDLWPLKAMGLIMGVARIFQRGRGSH